METGPISKEKYMSLVAKVKRIDEEMEKHSELLKAIQDIPTDLIEILTKRRKDFTKDSDRFSSSGDVYLSILRPGSKSLSLERWHALIKSFARAQPLSFVAIRMTS